MTPLFGRLGLSETIVHSLWERGGGYGHYVFHWHGQRKEKLQFLHTILDLVSTKEFLKRSLEINALHSAI